MKIIDLELYRWSITRRLKKNIFVSTLPRQSGKTTALIRMAQMLKNENEDFVVVVPSEYIRSYIVSKNIIPKNKIELLITHTLIFNFKGINYSDTNLLIDEYDIFDKSVLRDLTKLPWKSISMIGTLNI
jgi:thymidine kinase